MFLLYPIFVIKTSLNICFLYRHFVIEEPTFCYRRTDILLFINLGNPWRSKTIGGAKYIIKHIYKIYINKGLTSFRPKIYTFV